MNTEINNIVLTSSISETISILQNGVASACCNTIDRATGLILDLKVDNEVSADDIISVISDLRIVSSILIKTTKNRTNKTNWRSNKPSGRKP